LSHETCLQIAKISTISLDIPGQDHIKRLERQFTDLVTDLIGDVDCKLPEDCIPTGGRISQMGDLRAIYHEIKDGIGALKDALQHTKYASRFKTMEKHLDSWTAKVTEQYLQERELI